MYAAFAAFMPGGLLAANVMKCTHNYQLHHLVTPSTGTSLTASFHNSSKKKRTKVQHKVPFPAVSL